jgi:phospholipid/cholesterol/gamma-HCH transport system substrate-binding protein
MSGPLDVLRRRLDIIPSRHHTRPLLTGTIVITLTVLALLGAATRHVPFLPKSGRPVQAEFAAANQVNNRTVVRVNGIEVGRVDKVEAGRDPNHTTLVTMRIKNKDVVLHRDASAQVRWRTLLGGLMYIDLHPGSPSAPKLDGPIPVSRTSNQVEIDQVLQAYDGPTSQRQREMFKGLRSALADPPGVHRTIDTLPQTLPTVAQGLQGLRGRESDDLRGLIAATAKTLDGLAQTPELQNLVTGASHSLAVTEAHRRQLGQFLELSPPALDSTLTTMRRLRITLNHLDPTAAALRPGARELAPAARAATPTFRELEATLREARPLLRAAAPTLEALRGASASGTPLMQQLEPTLTRLDQELLPWLRKPDTSTRLATYEMIGPFWSDLASAASEFDSEGYRIRLTVPLNTNSIISSPMGNDMAAACERGGVPHADTMCTKLVKAVARSWFGTGRRPAR